MSDEVLVKALLSFHSWDEDTARAEARDINAALRELGHYVAENPLRRQDRERAERAAAREASRERAFARAVPYFGAIKQCQVSVLPSRGAPYRCSRLARFVTVSPWPPKPLVACGQHASDERAFPYSGWAGDPRPNIGEIEPEWVAAALGPERSEG